MSKEAMKLALDALEKIADWHGSYGPFPETTSLWQGMAITTARETFTAIKEAQAKQEQGEPVAWMQSDEVHISLWKDDFHTIPLYTTPQQRTWVGLTDEDTQEIYLQHHAAWQKFAKAIEAKLKEKNT